MTAYYNEIEPFAAQWLRNLIAAGHIAPSDVDERSIEDVVPDDIRPYAQAHFFAGIGVWSYALRSAGWPDDRPVWTGSCPCQPFSVAGKGAGFDDERHLWPAWHWLIAECRPAIIFGEQVASKAVEPWIDLVHADMEALDYAFGCVPFPSAGVGSPHIRDRAYWAAYAQRRAAKRQRLDVGSASCGMRSASREQRIRDDSRNGVAACRVAHDHDHGRAAQAVAELHYAKPHAESCCGARGVADDFVQQRPDRQPGIRPKHASAGRIEGATAVAGLRGDRNTGPTNGHWRAADWLLCRDGKWRPVEPDTFPLAHGATSRVGRLRAYGNAINAEQAKIFIQAAMECLP